MARNILRAVRPRFTARTWIAGVTLIAAVVAGCEPIATEFEAPQEVPVWQRETLVAPANPAPTRLKVMTWNVKYGAARIDFWFDEWGDRVEMTRAEVLANVEAAAALIREVAPDVLLVQEIEINSRRSAYVNMVRELLARTNLNYAAYVPTWRSRYVAEEGLGRIDLGNAIFSTYPIVRAQGIPQADRTDISALTRKFYIHRQVGRAEIRIGARDVAAMVVHTEAYDTDGTKSKQIDQIEQLLLDEPLPWVIGGDFNAIPPTAVKTDDFPDEPPSAKGTAFEQPPYDLADMQPMFDRYLPAITLARYGTTQAEQRRYFTHSVIGRHQLGVDGQPGFWNRTLDYLFVKAPSSWVAGSTDVLQQAGDSGIASDPMLLSDHCPTVGIWDIAP